MISIQACKDLMRHRSAYFIINLCLALIILGAAEVGRLLGIQGQALQISVVWPATGFSLTAILLFGFKVWPGILLGNLTYNFIHLASYTAPGLQPLLAAMTISLGSLIEALLAGLIIKRYSSPGYLDTVSDVFIFLVPAALISSFFASVIGVSTLFFGGTIPADRVIYNFMTFWLGDTFGVYIFTPLLIVWLTQQPRFRFLDYAGEAFLMLLTYIVLSTFVFYLNYPFAQLFIPLVMWVSYRFHQHGGTLAILFISVAAILSTTLGYGYYTHGFRIDPLPALVTFLLVVVTTALILAAVAREKAIAWKVVEGHNLQLRQEVNMHMQAISAMHGEMFVKEKLATLGMVTFGIARQMQPILEGINNSVTSSVESLDQLQKLLLEQRKRVDDSAAKTIESVLSNLIVRLKNVTKYEAQAEKIVEIIKSQSARLAPGAIEVKAVNLHTLINNCLDEIIAEKASKEAFFVSVIKEYDRSLTMIAVLPEELAYALFHLLDNAMDSMKAKKRRDGIDYEAVLKIRTINHTNHVDIVIRDNGAGVTDSQLEGILSSLSDERTHEEPDEILLALAHDIIVEVHHGDIKAASKEGEYFQVTVTLPKIHK